ncbi:MAG TPA: metalloregulator ArsR/SmtB family transcription factor [Candidatus Krumholzibacterium sp.]|nr:metalloregulator ArsR/SmtB family transcription factor [Candidatus Krumholzibacterium sp.]
MSGYKGDIPFDLIARRLKAMAEPSRLRLLHLLGGESMNVSELVEASGQSQAGVSKHLRILRQEGLVETRRVQRMVYYSLSSGLTREICDSVCRSIEEGIAGGREMLGNYWKAIDG